MASMIPPHDSLVKYHSPVVVTTARAAPKKGKKGPATPEKASTQTEDILNSILPPREWTEDGTLWVQYVSSTPATRLDVVNLQESLDRKLQQRQARETGICPVREELYAQCFDEVIRQVTINCAERGLLLLRVRDEVRMTIAAYQTLYESSIAFGMRKALTCVEINQCVGFLRPSQLRKPADEVTWSPQYSRNRRNWACLVYYVSWLLGL